MRGIMRYVLVVLLSVASLAGCGDIPTTGGSGQITIDNGPAPGTRGARQTP
jgi:hypothetical protein